MKIVLPGEQPISWNTMYVGKHWSFRSEEAIRVHTLIFYSCKKKLFETPVDITVTAYFKSRQLDSSNICAKFYEDGLKGRVIMDDTPKYVRSMKTVSLKDKLNPRVEILIEEV